MRKHRVQIVRMPTQCHVMFIWRIPSFHALMHSLRLYKPQILLSGNFFEWTDWVMVCVAYLWFGDIRDDTTEFCWEGRLVCRPWHHLQCSEYRLGTCTHTCQCIDPTLKESQPMQGNWRGVWIMHRNDSSVWECATPAPGTSAEKAGQKLWPQPWFAWGNVTYKHMHSRKALPPSSEPCGHHGNHVSVGVMIH